MKGSEFLYYKCDKINSNQGGSCIDCPDFIYIKKAARNLVNKKDKCFCCKSRIKS